MADTKDFPALWDQLVNTFSKIITTNLERRAASVFAVLGLSGELAIEYGLLPWESGTVLQACLTVFKRYQAYQGPELTEDAQISQSVSDFIAKHGDSRFSELHERFETTIYNRAGWYKDTENGRVYMLFPVTLIEAGGGYERSRIIDALKGANWLVEFDVGRATKKVRTSAGLKNLYHICESG